MDNIIALDSFPIITDCKIRYADTDRQGHVNSGVFSTFLEVGRSEILFNPHTPGQLACIRKELADLLTIIEKKDSEAMKNFLKEIRKKIV